VSTAPCVDDNLVRVSLDDPEHIFDPIYPGGPEVKISASSGFQTNFVRLSTVFADPCVRKVVVTSAGSAMGAAIAVVESLKQSNPLFGDSEVRIQTLQIERKVLYGPPEGNSDYRKMTELRDDDDSVLVPNGGFVLNHKSPALKIVILKSDRD